MKAMQPASARALIVTAVVIVLAGLLVPSPSGAFFAFCLAGLLTAFPAIFVTGKSRLLAAILLLSSTLLALGKYPEYRADQERYRQRTRTTVSADCRPPWGEIPLACPVTFPTGRRLWCIEPCCEAIVAI